MARQQVNRDITHHLKEDTTQEEWSASARVIQPDQIPSTQEITQYATHLREIESDACDALRRNKKVAHLVRFVGESLVTASHPTTH